MATTRTPHHQQADAPDLARELHTRHEPLRIGGRRLPADPYEAWLRRREAERAGIPVPPPGRRFVRSERRPWETILVRITGLER